MSARHRQLKRARYYERKREWWDKSDSTAYDDDDDGCDNRCHFCGGDGYVFGEDFGDPLWYDDDALYTCTCCHGSGHAKDCTWW